LLTGCSTTPPGQSPEERKADAYLTQGIDALQKRAYTDALRALLEAKKYNPKSPVIWTDLGIAYAGKKDLAKAEESWRKALKIAPGHNDARLNLGILYLDSKHYPQAERELKEAAKDHAYARADLIAMQLARLYLQLNGPLLAEQQLKTAVDENRNNCAAWSQLAKIQESRSDYAEAAQSMKGATIGICSRNPEGHYQMATLLMKAHQMPQAKAKLLEVIQLFPTSDWAKKSEQALNLIR
jgi:type IV pilus assembly protein PilF